MGALFDVLGVHGPTLGRVGEGLLLGYDVVYRLDGETASTRAEKKPGATIHLGEKDEIVGYDVTYRYEGQVDTVRTAEDPGKRLPVEDGVVQVGDRG